jgi:hypothetical protein
MSTATITGTLVFPASPSGNNQTIPIGAPVITAASTTGAQLTYTEGSAKTLVVAQADGIVTVSFDTITDADILYIGTDQGVSIVIDGSDTPIVLAAGGFIMIHLGSISSMTVATSGIDTATLTVALLGA